MLKFYHVNFRYTEDSPIILKNFNITFPENKISVIMSANGLGKSTILKLCARLIEPTEGVIFNSNDKISYVFQDDRLIDELTVYQNLKMILDLQKVPTGKSKKVKGKNGKYKTVYKWRRLTKQECEVKIKEMLKLLDIEQCINYYPAELSGSMIKRVCLARAFLHPSQLLLMDEPFNNLDIELKNEIIKIFIKLWNRSKKTVLFVTHSADEALSLANAIYFLSGKPLSSSKRLTIKGQIGYRDISSKSMYQYRKQILDYFIEKTKEEHK